MRIQQFFFLLLIFVSTSCAHHYGSMSAGSASITNDNFSKIRFAYGTSKITHVFGIGGNRKDALVLEAKRNMYQNCDLQLGEAIGQTTVDAKRSYFFPILTTKITVSAEIINFSEDTQNEKESKLELEKFINNKHGKSIGIGNEVDYYVHGDTIAAKVLDYDSEVYTILFFNKRNHLKTRRVGNSAINFPSEGVEIREDENKKIFTPKNPSNRLVRFKYEYEEYMGEILRTLGQTYIIRMERKDGSFVKIVVKKEDILD